MMNKTGMLFASLVMIAYLFASKVKFYLCHKKGEHYAPPFVLFND